MKKLIFKVLAILVLTMSLASSRAVAQVTITEEPDLSPEYVSSENYQNVYQNMYEDALNERVEQAAMEQQRQMLIVGGIAVAVAVALVFFLNRKPRKRRRHW